MSPAREASDSAHDYAGQGGRARDRIEGLSADLTGKATIAKDPTMKTMIRPKRRWIQAGRSQQHGSSRGGCDSDGSNDGGDEEGEGDSAVPTGQEPVPSLAGRVDTSDGRSAKKVGGTAGWLRRGQGVQATVQGGGGRH
jgi:hypothetical protein